MNASIETEAKFMQPFFVAVQERNILVYFPEAENREEAANYVRGWLETGDDIEEIDVDEAEESRGEDEPKFSLLHVERHRKILTKPIVIPS